MLEEEFYSLGESPEPENEPDNTEPNSTETTDTVETAPVETDTEPTGEEISEGEEFTEESEEQSATDADEPEQTSQSNPFEGKTAEEVQRMFAEIQARKQQDTAFNRAAQNAIGATNPYTGQIIQTVDDYKAYVDEHTKRAEAEKYNDFFTGLQQGTATKDDFDNYVRSLVQGLPEVQQAKEAKRQADLLAQEAQRAKSLSLLKADIDKFNAEMPSCKIKKIEDVQNDTEVTQYINMGLTFDKAYKLAHMDEIMSAKTSAVKQATITNQQNKSHLKATGGNSAESVTVPDEEMKVYKQFFPDWTAKQILEDYKKRI